MVDAQAPGVASQLRRIAAIPMTGEGWPGRLLAEYAQLHLLARAHAQLDALEGDLAAVVRSRIGYTVRTSEVLNAPAVTDHWQILAMRDVIDAPVPFRRLWLRGRDTERPALLLIFEPGGRFEVHPDGGLRPGQELHAGLHFYPGRPPLRAVIGGRHGEVRPASEPSGACDVTAALASFAGALAADPWLTEWPMLLVGTPCDTGAGWQIVDPSGNAVTALTTGIDMWNLAAVAGGRPATVAGEWGPDGFLPLTTWHDGRPVRL
jgi:hypothetical protein